MLVYWNKTFIFTCHIVCSSLDVHIKIYSQSLSFLLHGLGCMLNIVIPQVLNSLSHEQTTCMYGVLGAMQAQDIAVQIQVYMCYRSSFYLLLEQIVFTTFKTLFALLFSGCPQFLSCIIISLLCTAMLVGGFILFGLKVCIHLLHTILYGRIISIKSNYNFSLSS